MRNFCIPYKRQKVTWSLKFCTKWPYSYSYNIHATIATVKCKHRPSFYMLVIIAMSQSKEIREHTFYFFSFRANRKAPLHSSASIPDWSFQEFDSYWHCTFRRLVKPVLIWSQVLKFKIPNWDVSGFITFGSLYVRPSIRLSVREITQIRIGIVGLLSNKILSEQDIGDKKTNVPCPRLSRCRHAKTGIPPC